MFGFGNKKFKYYRLDSRFESNGIIYFCDNYRDLEDSLFFVELWDLQIRSVGNPIQGLGYWNHGWKIIKNVVILT